MADVREEQAPDQIGTAFAAASARRRLRSRPRVFAFTVAVGAAAVAALLAFSGVFGSAQGSDAAPAATATSTVARRDLVQRSTVPGTLGYADAREVVNYRRDTITSLPDEGGVLRPGAVLYRVNAQPVVLFSGGQPAWRPLAAGVSDGRDVRQLEQNLHELGYDDERQLTIDERFSIATAAAGPARHKRRLGETARYGRTIDAEEALARATAGVGFRSGSACPSGLPPSDGHDVVSDSPRSR
jgi:hypothetical protein